MMKILVVKSNFYLYGESLAQAFKDLGHEVMVFQQSGMKDNLIVNSISRALWLIKQRLFHTDCLYSKPDFLLIDENERLFQCYCQFKPDVIIAHPGYFISRNTLKKIKCKKVIWIYDSIHRMPKLQKKMDQYDKIYYFEGSDAPYFEQNGLNASFLPLCLEPKVYKPVLAEKSVDVSFVGNLSDERIDFFINLKKYFPELVIKVYGVIPKNYMIKGEHRKEIEYYGDMFVNRSLSPKEVAELYSRSKICLNIHHCQSKYGVNARFYEILGCKGFEIVNYNDFIKKYYSDSVVVYQNDDDLYEKIKYFLEHEDERLQIATTGYRKVIENDCFINRAEIILNEVSELSFDE